MLLSDKGIREALDSGHIHINPWRPDSTGPASYDVRLGNTLLLPSEPVVRPNWFVRFLESTGTLRQRSNVVMYADPGSQRQPLTEVKLFSQERDEAFWLPPGGVALGHTEESLTLNPASPIAADIAGCSSLGRWWIFIHATAGFIDPGWEGQLTLELYNASPFYLRLWAGMRIAQLRFYKMDQPSARPYTVTGHYLHSRGAVGSKYVS